MAKLLYNLLFKNSSEIQNEYCDKAFKELKEIVIIKLVIAYFNLKKETFIKCDFNDIIIKGILS